jgi:hypothetical protein
LDSSTIGQRLLHYELWGLSTKCDDGRMHWQGEVLDIHIAPKASAPMDALSEARLVAGVGLEGDRYTTGLGSTL